MAKKVGIILINYQDYARRFLTPCRDSLRQQSYPTELTNIYIIDNAASPETQAYLKNIYPEAKIIPRPDGNYAAANNLGFKAALDDNCEYIVSVNMDTEMDKEWLRELILALESNSEAAIAQSKILLYPKTEEEKLKPRVNSLGNIIHFLGFGFTSKHGEQDDRILEKSANGIRAYSEIKGYASGCSFIIRASILPEITDGDEYYNEEYYMYHDDMELSLKVRLLGYKIILAPESRIFHKYEFNRSTKMIYYMERNRYLTMLIFYPRSLLLLIALPALVMDIGMIFYSLLGGWFKEERKIYRYFLSGQNYDKILKARASVKKISTVPFTTIARDFSGRIEFQEIANPILTYLVNPLMNFYWRLIKKIV